MPYVHVTLASGRTLEQKQALMAKVAHAVQEALDVPIDNVRVWITDVDPAQLSVGGVSLAERRARSAE